MYLFLQRLKAMGSSSPAVLSLVLFFLLSEPSVNISDGANYPHVRANSKRVRQKLSHLHFYFHDTVTGSNPSAMPITPNKTASGFGLTFVIDDPLTQGPEASSKLVGRAQGIYSLASQRDLELLMLLNFVFVAGKYNGSSLSIMGRNAVFTAVREMPVIGGTGLFRWARGYAQASSVLFNAATQNAVVEYHVHVLHY